MRAWIAMQVASVTATHTHITKPSRDTHRHLVIAMADYIKSLGLDLIYLQSQKVKNLDELKTVCRASGQR